MMNMDTRAPNIVIVPKNDQQTVTVSSNILSQFAVAGSPNKQNNGESSQVTSSANGTGSKSSTGENLELRVFKHKDVNTLIRNRIMALENSVVSKTVERKPLKEVDMTITEVKLNENDSEIIKELSENIEKRKEDEVKIPTSTIRQLAQQMQKEQPAMEIEIKPLPAEEQVIKRPYQNKSILKPPVEEEKPPKPALKSQYSFSMDRKFHEEADQDGWQQVQDIAATDSGDESEDESSSSESEEESSDEPEPIPVVQESESESDSTTIPSPPPPPLKRDDKKKKKSEKPRKISTSESDQSSVVSEEEEIRTLSPETVKKILAYGEEDSEYYGEGESFEDYRRRKYEDRLLDQQPYYSSDSDYTIDDRSVFTDYTSTFDSASYVDERVYDSEVEREGYYYPGDEGEYTESFTEEGYNSELYYEREYSDENETLVDEQEYRPHDDTHNHSSYQPGNHSGYMSTDVYESNAESYFTRGTAVEPVFRKSGRRFN